MHFITDIAPQLGLTLHPLYLGLGVTGMLFAFAAGVQALWRYARAKR